MEPCPSSNLPKGNEEAASAFHMHSRGKMTDLESATSTRCSTIRVMTWNIHGARTMFGKPDLSRIIGHVRGHGPDIIALQEVDSRRCGDPLAFETLAKSLGEHRAEARMILAPEGDYGHILLTRWPMRETKLHDISVARREARAAIEAVVDTPLGPLRVIAVHLGLSLRERHRQSRRLADLAASSPLPLVMLGDFNDWFWHGSVQRSLREMFPGRSRFRTFPAAWPMFRLDRIYVRPAHMLRNMFVAHDERSASDHLPVVADVGIDGS
jgi:endonuclease/exonuclease/phosphatase family metal-dependent hydrolase